MKKIAAAFVLLAGSGGLAVADEVNDTVADALKAYEGKEFSQAVELLDYASQLIRQQKGAQLESVLPAPLDGWEAEKASSNAAAGAMFGGGVTAERKYKNGNKRVTVSLVTDSPMVQSMMALYRNPMFASAGGGKVKRIHGETAVVKYESDKSRGEVTVVIGNVLLSVKGKASEDELFAFMENVNVANLK